MATHSYGDLDQANILKETLRLFFGKVNPKIADSWASGFR